MTTNTGRDIKKRRSQTEVRPIHIYHLSQSGMRFTKLENLGDNTKLLALVHKLIFTYCVPFLSRE
jgi:hypothetical protein